MKSSYMNTLRLTVGIAFATSTALFAQTTATTDPVGFITLAVTGTGGSVPSQLSFRGLGLTRAVEYQGSAETIGTNTVTDNEATWTDNQFNGANGAYFLEVISVNGSTTAAGVGTTYDITATTDASNSITLAQNLAAGMTAPVGFKVRKHWTIASVFGAANEGGLQGGTSSTADLVLIYNGTSYDSYFYSTGGLPGVGWRKTGAGSTNQANVVIYPEDGMAIQRQQTAVANVVVMGAVKTGQTSVPVLAGINIIGNVYAAPMTLASSGLYTGNSSTGLTSGTSSTADQVQIYNGTGYDTYFYSSGGLAGVGWRKTGGGSTDQSTVSIPVGSSIIVQRIAGTAFNWVAPQHPATL